MDIRDVVSQDPDHAIVIKLPEPLRINGPMASVDYIESLFGPQAKGFRGVIALSMGKGKKTAPDKTPLITHGYIWYPNQMLPLPDHYHRIVAEFPNTRNVLFFAFRADHEQARTMFPQEVWEAFTDAWRAFGDKYENNPDRKKEQKKLGKGGVVLGGGPNADHVVDFGVVINEYSEGDWSRPRDHGVQFMGLDRFVHFSSERYKDFDSVKDKLPPEIKEVGELLQKLVESLPPDKQEVIKKKVEKLQQLDREGVLDKVLEDDALEIDEEGNTVIPPDYFKKKPPTTH